MYIEENGWMLELIFDLSSQALIQMINQLFHTAYSDEEKIWKEWQRANSIGLKVGETNRYEFQVRRLDGCTLSNGSTTNLPYFLSSEISAISILGLLNTTTKKPLLFCVG